MKKIFLSIVLLMTVTIGIAQYASRNMVVVEVGTGTWCQWCPYAAMGVDDMLSNGDSVAVIENHNGDAYAYASSNARNTMYNITGYPSASFDGMIGIAGTYGPSTMFPYYHPMYVTRMGTPSPVEMEMTVTHTGLDYTVNVTMTKLNTITATTLKLHLVITESHIPKSWQGMSELNFVNRKMVPDANGTAVSFTSGNVQTAVLSFSMDPSWNLNNCEIVAFLQDMATGQGDIPGTSNPPYGSMHKFQTFQGIKYAVTPLTADFTADVTQVSTNGNVQFTSQVQGGFVLAPITYAWSFPGANPDHSSDANPLVSYTACGPHDVTLVVTGSGQTNTNLKSNYISVSPYINIVAIPRDTVCSPSKITLNGTILDGASYLWSPGGATTAMITLDPLVIGLGSHTYTLVATSIDGCSNSDTATIVFQECTGVKEQTFNLTALAYPNPVHGSFTMELTTKQGESADVKIISPLGNTVYAENFMSLTGKIVKEISMASVSPGIYLLVLQSGGQKTTLKLFVN